MVGGGLAFENAGTLDVRAGELRFERPSTQAGASFAVSAGALLRFASFPVHFEGTTSGTPEGTVTLDTEITADAAVWDLGGTGVEWTADYLNGGSLTNAGLVRLTGASGSRGVRGPTSAFTNEGTVEFSGTGRFYVYNGAAVANEALWEVTDEGDLYGSTGASTFTNAETGTLRKRGDGLAQVVGGGLAFENAGTLDVRGGELRFERPSTQAGAVLAVAEGAVLRFASFPVHFEGTTSGDPAGTLTLDTDVTAAPGAVWAFGGTGMEWTADYLNGGSLTNAGLVRLTGASGSRGVRGDGVRFRNTGVVEFSGTGRFYISNGARAENAADWRITEGGDLYGSTGLGTFVNEADATLTASGADATAQVVGGGLVFENAGTLDVRAGTLAFARPSTHTDATFTVAEDALLHFDTFSVRFEGVTSGDPAGTARISTDFTAADGAVWDLGGTGMEWTSDYLNGGALTNAGRLRLTTGTASRGVRNAAAALTNEGTVEFADDGRFYVHNGATVTNEGLWEVTDGGDLYGSTGTGTFTNTAGATLRKRGDGLAQVVGGGLAFENAGTLDVRAGELRFERPSTQAGASFAVSAGALLRFASFPVHFEGTTSGTPEGTVTLDTEITADAAVWDLGGTGVEWTADYLNEGSLTNAGLVRLTGASGSRGVRGGSSSFRNDGTVEHTGAGRFYVYGGASATNAADWRITEGGDLWGFTGAGTFTNTASATLTASGAETTQIVGGGLTVSNAGTVDVREGTLSVSRPFTHLPGAVLMGSGTFEPGTQFALQGTLAPGTSPGLLSWTGRYAPEATADLAIEIGGSEPGTGHDQLAVSGEAAASGRLTAEVLPGYTPTDGEVLTVLTATSVTGGFTFEGLVDPVADVSLYPDVTETAVTLTAFNGIPTVSGPLAVTPAEAVNNQTVEFVVTGTGFAPDLSIVLECDDCFEPEAGTVPGRVRRIRPNEIVVLFELAPEIAGSYDVVVTDPRGGEARTGITIADAPPTLSLTTLDGQASETGRDPGVFVIASDRPLREPLEVSVQLSGSAVHFVDYMTDVIRNTVRIPAGVDSVAVGIYPLNDDLDESTETVTMRLLYDGETGPTLASLGITDGPPQDAFEVYVATPDHAANLGLFSLTVGGQGFTSGSSVRLGGNGGLDPVRTEVNEAGTILTAQFQLADQPFGPRDVIVESGTGESRTLPGALTVEGPTFPEVSVRVLAPSRVPRTRMRTYTLLLHNRGNVDVIGYPALSGLPPGTEWETDFVAESLTGGPTLPWHELTAPHEHEDGVVISLPVMLLPAGSTREVEIRAAVGTPQTLTLVGGWMYVK